MVSRLKLCTRERQVAIFLTLALKPFVHTQELSSLHDWIRVV